MRRDEVITKQQGWIKGEKNVKYSKISAYMTSIWFYRNDNPRVVNMRDAATWFGNTNERVR